jgi:cytidylate kinase
MPFTGKSALAPPPKRDDFADAAGVELVALRAIVLTVAGALARSYESAGQGPAQEWINKIAALATEAVAQPESTIAEDKPIREKAVERIRQILSEITNLRKAGRSN